MADVFEYRGVDGLVIAEVLEDSAEKFTTGEVESLLPVAEIGKTTEHSNDVHYYDNKALIVIAGEGPDEISITGAGLTLEKAAKIAGKSYDPTTGALIDGPRRVRHFALGYRTKDTDGFYRYVWRLKGMFSIPDDSHKTEDNGTEANGTELTYTGIYTNHVFDKAVYEDGKWLPGSAKGLIVSDREGLTDVSKFFEAVVTPDTLTAKTA